MLSKQQLRQAFRTNLERDTDASLFETRSLQLSDRVVSFMAKRSGFWAGFMPVGFEPDVSTVYSKIAKSNPEVTWAFPRVEHDTLSFYVPTGPLVVNKWNILEPDPRASEPVAIRDLAGLLVPGLAFDLQCNRLGRGRGYYDRALGSGGLNTNTVKVGIAFDRQIASSMLPTDPHDQAMDFVITESRAIERNQ